MLRQYLQHVYKHTNKKCYHHFKVNASNGSSTILHNEEIVFRKKNSVV
jgi:hypothetical protein